MSAPLPGERHFQCGSGEMGTLYWSKDSDPDKLPEMNPGYPPEIEGQPGTRTNPLRARGTIREIAERVKAGKWTTLDLDALADYVLERER